MKNQRRARQRGVALMAALGFTFVILALGLALMGLTTTELKSTKSEANTVVARNAAEAGVEIALNQWNVGTKPTTLTGNVSATVGGTSSTVGSYSVTCVQNTTTNTLAITSVGKDSTQPSNVPGQTIKVMVAGSGSGGGSAKPFAMAGFAKGTISLSGSPHTNSYDSSAGPYNASTAKTNGGLGTASTSTTAISASGGPDIKGMVVGPPGGNSTAMKAAWSANWAYPTGGFGVAAQATSVPDVVMPTNGVAFSTVPVSKRNTSTGQLYDAPNGGNSLVPARTYDSWSNNYTWNIPSGTYNVDQINLSSDQNVININGDVTLVCNGNMTTGGNTAFKINGSLKIVANGNVDIGASFTTIDPNNIYQPSKVQILGTPNCTSVNWSGYNDYIGVIYAPEATVNLTASSNIYGAVVGNNIVINGNSSIHYDEQLSKVGVTAGSNASSTYTVTSWEQD